MIAIATLLDPPYGQTILDLWEKLELRCELAGIKTTPLPHISWQSADDYNLDAIRLVLSEFAIQTEKFEATSSNLGVFSGKTPILYLAVSKSQRIAELHEKLWNMTAFHAVGINPYYSPENWIPHITLAYRDINDAKLNCAIQDLAVDTSRFNFLVNNIAIIYQQDGLDGIKEKYFLKGDS